ncbi:MAG: hypothetical protein WCR28_00160 [Candidatus Izemoplasmatales bacterium]|nr:hypothetical protein [Candidatus Izemoplasmatales bacterium]
MVFLVNIGELNWTLIIILAVGFIALMIFLAIMINKGKYAARYKRFYKKMDRMITKKYNGNLLNEVLINSQMKDERNMYKSLKGKGKRLVRKYFDYYTKNLPELAFLKSFISSDKKKGQLVILYLNELDKVIFRWDKSKKMRGFIKSVNKYQMLTPLIGYLYELPLHIHEGVPYRMTNHDNGLILSYDIVKSAKHIKRKQKPKKLSKKELKAQERVQSTKLKKSQKASKKA